MYESFCASCNISIDLTEDSNMETIFKGSLTITALF